MTQVLSTPAGARMDGPFGYAFFNDGRDEPAPPSEPMAQGKPLLSDSEANLTNRLFSGLSDQHLLESLAQFQSEPVPSLYGSSSHFGHPEMDLARLGLFPQQQPQQQQQPNLYNTPPLSAPAHTSVFPDQSQPFGFQSQQQQTQAQTTQPMTMQHRAHTFVKPSQTSPVKAGPSGRVFGRRASTTDPSAIPVGGRIYNQTARNMLKEGRQARPDSYLERRMTFTYGSDTAFKGNSYQPSEDLQTAQRLIEEQKITLPEFSFQSSMRRGHPASSIAASDDSSLPGTARDLPSDLSELKDVLNGSRKRLRSEDEDDGEEYDQPDSSIFGAGRKKTRPSISTSGGNGFHDPRSPNGATKTPMTPGGSNNKPSDSSSKPGRVNLTEEEKKMNHIKSEQKRRNQIKEGFADLTELMPDAANAGPSKCTILAKAVEWLHDLIEGNNVLKEQLANINETSTPETAK